MFRKALFILILLPIIGAITVVSCRKPEASICSFRLRIETDSVVPASSLKIKIEIHDDFGYDCYAPRQNPFISGCYAMSRPCVKWINSLVFASMTLSFDRPLIIAGDTLHAGSNFLDHPLINGKGKFTKEEACNTIYYTLELKEAVLQHMTFDTGVYHATLLCETSDKRSLRSEYGVTFIR